MENFVRALKESIKYWPQLALAAACSLAIAFLWGANIGGFYPILEVTIRGESLQDWLDNEIAKSELAIHEISKEQSALLLDSDPAKLESDKSLSFRVDALSNQRRIEQAKLDGYLKLKPWIDGWIPSSPFGTIGLIVAVLMISTLAKQLFQISNEYLVGRVALDLTRELRMRVFSKAIHMDRAGYAEMGASGYTSTLTHNTDVLSSGLIAALGAVVREPLKAIACLAGAAIISWRLLLLSAIIAPAVGFLLVLVTRRIKAASRRMLERARGFHEVMHESFGSINTVQSYQMEGREEQRFCDATLQMRNYGLRYIFYSSLSKPIIEFLGLAMLGTTIVCGAYLVLNQATHLFGLPICDTPLTISQLLIFFGMLIGLSDPLRKLSAAYSAVYAGAVAADTVYGIIDRENLIQDPIDPQTTSSPHRVLSIEHVTFGYDPANPILRDVSLEIPFGSTVAVVGHNGSGKSTLINLLCRFYDPQQGSLTFDGVALNDMSLKDVRRRVALVTQQTELFNDSVAYNIRYGAPQATDEQVRAVAVESHADDFISTTLRDGYDTIVGPNGNRLSGGQRQRIALARALLCNPEILILDEATSQIDMLSEQLICDSLAHHRGKRTMVIITHREKLLELADRVLELNNGKLIEVTHLHRAAA